MSWSRPPDRMRLDPDDTHLWRASLDLAPIELQGLQPILSPDELQRAARFRIPAARERFIAARAALRIILARYGEVDPQSLRFDYHRAGKPYLASGARPELRFSVSHSHTMALFGVALGREIGVDLERVRETGVDYEGIAHRFFSPSEAALLDAVAPESRADLFFRLWTLKESYVKARGEGLRIPLSSFEILIPSGRAEASLRIPEHSAAGERWTLTSFDAEIGYAAAVAVEGRKPRFNFWQWQPPGKEVS